MKLRSQLDVPPKKVCVAVAAESTEEAIAVARKAEAAADVIEIRLDSLADPAIAPFADTLNKPLLFTNRPTWEGGHFEGGEAQRITLLEQAIQAGAAYVDIELKTEADRRNRLLAAANESGTESVISWHDFKSTPSPQALSSIFQEQYRSGARIGKIVTMARDFQDVLRVLGLQIQAAEMGFPLIAFCMGRPGMISRVATLEMGGFMTYAAPDDGRATAPGQIKVSSLRTILGNMTDAD